MDVLIRIQRTELPRLDPRLQGRKRVEHGGQFRRRQIPALRQRSGVGLRSGDVVRVELPVEVGRATQRSELRRRTISETGTPEGALATRADGFVTTCPAGPGGPKSSRQRPDLDEALRQGLVERVAGVVGGQAEVVQALLALATRDDGAAALELQADFAGHVLLGVVDEDVKRALETRVPETVVDEVRPLGLDAALVATEITLESQAFELLVCGNERDRPGCLVDFATLDADQSVLDDVDPTDAMLAGQDVHDLDDLERAVRNTVDCGRDPAVKVMVISSASRSTSGSCVYS